MTRVLVLNRGEIAVRACLAARRLGARAILFVTPGDETGLAPKHADELYLCPHDEPARSWLDLDQIAAAIRETGAEVVYPGYGFLSESEALSATVREAGARFCGPAPEVMAELGHKQRARSFAARCGLRDLGVEQPVEADYPLMLKAVRGGGGRGNAVVVAPAELDRSLTELKTRAGRWFGDDAVLFERLVTRARHVEVQVFGSRSGVRVLGTRDCTLQRRHQKVIEEGPADTAIEAALVPSLERIARALTEIGYRGAGTVELLWDVERRELWFLEVNPRIQVEHPVTELVFGVDLVEWQLREAIEGDIPDRPLEPRGHAVQARVYAEDPRAGFLPDPGLVHHLSVPPIPFVRWDAGVSAGTRVLAQFDPMIGKLLAWGADRDEALDRLGHALSHLVVHGVRTNLSFLETLVRHPDFRGQRHHTRWLEESMLPAYGEADPPDEAARVAEQLASRPVRTRPQENPWKHRHRV